MTTILISTTPERAISINEPFAWLIVAGFKPIENRPWNTSFCGQVVIHASSAKRWMNEDTEAEILGACPQLAPIFDDRRISDGNPLFYFGAFVGVAEIVGCVAMPPDGDFRAACLAAGHGDWYKRAQARHGIPPEVWASGDCCILLDSPKQFAKPIPAKGKLSLYRLTEAEQAAVAVALRGPLGMPFVFQDRINKAKAKAARKPAATVAPTHR